jgi:uncharacterized protein YfcZ (UPF0381/DUF406 family)
MFYHVSDREYPSIIFGEGKIVLYGRISTDKQATELVFHNSEEPREVGSVFDKELCDPKFSLFFKNKKGLQVLIKNLQDLERKMEGEDARLSDLGEGN